MQIGPRFFVSPSAYKKTLLSDPGTPIEIQSSDQGIYFSDQGMYFVASAALKPIQNLPMEWWKAPLDTPDPATIKAQRRPTVPLAPTPGRRRIRLDG